MTYEDFKTFMHMYMAEQSSKGVPQDKDRWENKAWSFVTMSGISDGNRPYSTVSRVELWGMLRLFYELIIKTVGGKK